MTKGPNQLAWIAALRSGKYEQGSGYLLDDHGGYCCLGVGAKVLGVDDLALVGHGVLDEEWKADLGLRSSSGEARITGKDDKPSLAECNDVVGLTLSEIADLLENDENTYFLEAR